MKDLLGLYLLCFAAFFSTQGNGQTAPRKKLVTAVLYRKAQFECSVKSPNAAEVEIWWQLQEKNVTTHNIDVSKSADGTVSSQLTIKRVSWADGGTYSCLVRELNSQDPPTKQDVQLEIYAEPQKVSSTDGSGEVGGSTRMSCTFQGKPLPTITWLRHGKELESDDVKYSVSVDEISHKEIASYLEVFDLSHYDNGTYLCHANNDYTPAVAMINSIVFDKPVVELDLVKAVDNDKIFVNWTITEWNSPVTDYFLFYRKASENAWVNYIDQKIPTEASSFVVKGLVPDTGYMIKLGAKNKYGRGEYSEYNPVVKTLNWSPMVFVPSVGLKGLTWNSISIGWTSPSFDDEDDDRNFLEFIHYYKLTRKSDDHTLNVYQSTADHPVYLWRNLEAATDYAFTVAACNGFTQECGAPSNIVTGTTEDGLSSQPSNVQMNCQFDKMGFVDVTWNPPMKPNGQIEFYNIILKGAATYVNSEGRLITDKIGPEIKTYSNEPSSSGASMKTRFDFLSPNTNYNASVCAVTRRKDCGEAASVSCKMDSTPPKQEQMRGFQWSNGRRNGREIFRLKTPKLSERNGPICCLRVVVVRMRHGSAIEEIQDPSQLEITTYRKAHDSPGSWGAYIAEILGPNILGHDIFVGDGQNIIAASSTSGGSRCPACHSGVHAHLLTAANIAEMNATKRFQRNVVAPTELVEDGFLDLDSNYTAFVEVIVPENNVGRSPYMIPHKPGEIVYSPGSANSQGGAVSTVLICVLGVLAGLVTVALFLLIALLFLRRYSKQVAASQEGSVEMDLMRSLRHFISNTLRGGRDHSQYLITPNGEPNATRTTTCNGASASNKEDWKPADIPAIKSSDLVAAYLERHKDSDYGFQAEFELLPDRYPDRTTEVCDRAVNNGKNRYPDIRCYDQTRVKLTPLTTLPQLPDGPSSPVASSSSDNDSSDSNAPCVIDGSDYINANFVPGYKNRKMWICAQGPLERTIADFWRMIYEQGTNMIIMLTNLEEYNRVKCAQYWPGAGDSNYVVSPHCLINVGFCTEKRYSDYIVRELNMTVKTQKKDEDKATTTMRTVRHYHYLQWKDFNAPEHAPGMLRFIKRINEQHSQSPKTSSGPRPIVVHCSAGVGRSGTLIAIDNLMQELREDNQVSIYKNVCELRRSRNYLVQSVKQYMFVYRAIMEMSQFGDTELEASEIKSTWKSLSTEDDRMKPQNQTSKLNQEFAKLANIVDDRKALSVGTNEENNSKNQTEKVIPFDRNRVILTPDGLRPHSTYINASFIEGYHNDESFIITQDPLPNTAEDFWRMVTEHSIRTMVQLTDIGDEDKAWLYYPEKKSDEGLTFSEFGSMRVSLDNREDHASYVMRDLTVYNGKADESIKLTHFAYKRWRSSGSGSDDVILPASTGGLLDLVEHATAHKIEMKRSGPIAVHCKYGSDRSSVYVALSCLVQQVKNESRADVFTVVRKLRSQRQGMIQHPEQYKFIYRAIADYVDLYNSKDDEEYQYSVPINSVPTRANGSLPRRQ